MDTKIKPEIKSNEFLAKFIERYQHQVCQVCFYMIGNRKEAVKLAQSAFVKVYLKAENYNYDNVSTGLFRITSELVMESLREEMITKYVDKEVAEPLLLDTTQKEILQLTFNTRLAIILKHMVGLSVQEISDIMQIPISSVREKIYHGREMLRIRLNYN